MRNRIKKLFFALVALALVSGLGFSGQAHGCTTYTINASAGSGGSISPSGSPSGAVVVNYGANKTFTISANTGYHISDVKVDNISQGAVSSYTFTNVIANHSISASFAIDTYTITYTASTNGSISGTTPQTVNYGADGSEVTAVPDPGYHFVNWSDDSTDNPRTDTNVTADISVEASFAIDTYTINASAGSGGSISPSGDVTVEYGGNQAFTISANTGYHIQDVLVDSVSVGNVTSYDFTNVTASHTIAATFAINTYTITASAGSGGSISPSGDVVVNSGSSQTFTISANTGYHIQDVLVDSVSVGNVSSYDFTNVTANHSISASFAINTYTITTSAGPHGSIAPSGAVTVNYGANQGFTITAAAHYHVADVLVDNVSQGAVSSYTFTSVTTNHFIAATFAINTYTITTSPGAHGSISPANPTVNYGTNKTLTISANTGYHISDVKVDNVSQGAISSYTFTNVTANHSIAATFDINTYTYTINASAGSGGSISPSGAVSVNHGSDQGFSISTDTCYHIEDVLVDSISVGSVSSYDFTDVQGNHTIAASFDIDEFTITASAGAHGSISPSGDVTVECGGNQAFIISANTCYHIEDVLVDSVSVGNVSSYDFTNVTADHTIAASFAINTYTITASAGAHGSISPSGDVTVECGGNQTFTISADTCYHIADVVVDSVSQGAISSYTFTNVTADHTIAASFDIDEFTITASAGAHGSISPSGDVTVECGGNQAFIISADTCYHIEDVLVDSGSVGNVTSYEFTDVQGNHTIAANFAIDTFTLTYTAGANGNITGISPQTVNCGGNGTEVTAVPDACYHFVKWSDDVITASRTDTNVTGNITVTANFAIDTFTLTYTAGANGNITGISPQTVSCGGNGTLVTAGPDAGYHFVKWSDDVLTASRTDTNVTGNITVTANFAIDTFTASSAGANGFAPEPTATPAPTPTPTPSPTPAPTPMPTPAETLVLWGIIGGIGYGGEIQLPGTTATPTPTPATTPTASPTPTPTPTSGGATVPWAMIGEIIGGMFFVALFIFLLLRWFGRPRPD